MSWVAVSFAIVAGILLGGWVSYERSRPSARMVAVVGTLAALAALGRDAFAALPEVKPITAMTLVVGYALGPLPGFAVGAIGMLASNLMLGEGSYTPWQMAAWGMVGLLGAGLGALSGRRLPRVAIALACALSALGAKEAMNLYTWTFGASHTPAAFLAVAGTALPFDITDTLASFLFGLAFGPELARVLARTRTRMTVAWEPPPPAAWDTPPASTAASVSLRLFAILAAAAALAFASPAGSARASRASAADAVSRAVAYLRSAQNGDGGFGGEPGVRSNELYSAWAALGLAAAGDDPARFARTGHSVLDAIRAQAGTLSGAGDLERTILALHACGVPARLPGLGSLVARLLRYRSADGSFEHLVNITSFAVLALRAGGRPAGDPVVQAAAGWLERQQSAGGGFGYAGRGAPDVDDTAGALQALAAAGRPSHAVGRAVAFLLSAANRDGGFPQQPGGESNAQSTAWAVQAMVAAHRDPAAALPGAARSPLAYLQGLVQPGGSVRYARSVFQTPVWVTAQALTALARAPLPIQPPPASGSAAVPGGSSGSRASRSSQAAAGGRPTGQSSAGGRVAGGAGGSAGGRAGGGALGSAGGSVGGSAGGGRKGAGLGTGGAATSASALGRIFAGELPTSVRSAPGAELVALVRALPQPAIDRAWGVLIAAVLV